ncbi:adenosylcobinamide-GDP ribazoletransferase [Vreelandella olivaria]|uniref:Adenosylcobinamide-GDP ribazoletransferase n=1 Tax=Vreelandella olivaria TaxID=390919 RepID=A0ABM7GLR7_9GAMM|nr:adenosylcobinamide-GDP ribazoletransferase [Halomonas olivaria]
MKNALFGLLLALQFLTRIPIPIAVPWTPDTRRWAVRAYPLVGLLIGSVLVLLAFAMPNVPTPITALAILSVWVALSGGLHLDGVMDIADALGSNQAAGAPLGDYERPTNRQFWNAGATVSARLEGRAAVGIAHLSSAALVAAGGARTRALGGVALLVLTPCAQPKGLAWSWQQSLSGQDVALALLPLVLIALLAPPVVLIGLTGMVFVVLMRWFMLRLFNGINGDMVGATIEGGELWLLILVWSWWQFATVSPLGI